jgi:exonuclease SbcD
MKFLHTADWHLGRHFHGTSLLDDQAHVLDEVVRLAVDERVDAVVIAGDVYDRAVPPAEAVSLLGDVLERLVVHAGIPVVLIAGNHDSAERIGFGGRILERQQLFVRGGLAELGPIVLQGADGAVAFHPLPYVEPAFARGLEGGGDITDHASAMANVVGRIRTRFQPGRPNVLVGHAFVSGGSESESERPLSVGGSGMVPHETFAGFDYVALGHLHRPQSAGADHIRYSGSLLKYSFQESGHDKGVSVVRVGPDGRCEVQHMRLPARRDVRVISGTFEQLRSAAAGGADRTDYLCAELTDTGPVLEPMMRLREAYPNLMEIRFRRTETAAGPAGRVQGDHRKRDPADLFRSFWRDVAAEDIPASHLDAFRLHVQPIVSGREEPAA